VKRRLLKIFLIGLAVLAFTGYFAFSTFLFSPTESDYAADVSTLIPRDVDFYVSKADLADDFDAFPTLAVADELAGTEGGRTFLASPEWASLKAEQGVSEALHQIEDAVASLPFAVDPLEVVGGSDIAVAGYFRGADFAQADWSVYARGNWMAKLGLALFQYPGLLNLESQGLEAVIADDVISLSGGQLPRAIHLTRVKDVVVLASDPAVARAAHELAAKSGEDSFGGSARYYDHVQQRERDGNELELFVDYRALSEAMQYSGRWPDPASQDFFPAFMGRLFQSGSLKELVGIAGFGGGLSLDLHAALSSEAVTPFQKQLYRMRGFERANLYDVARYAPKDAGVFGFFRAGLGPLLREMLQASERALQDNLDDLVREIWTYPDVGPLIDELDAAFHDRIAVVVGANDYPPDPNGPPHNDDPVLAWSLVLWVDNVEKVEELRKKIIDNQKSFGIQGRESGSPGVFTNELRGGQIYHEYWSQFVPGTGHIATVMDQGVFLISNSFGMLDEIVKTRYEGAPAFPRLAEEPRFQALVESSMPYASLILWGNPSGLASTLRAMAQRRAEDEVDPNWAVMRAKIDRDVLAKNFPDWNYDELTQDQSDQLEVFAGPERNRYERELREAQVPALRAVYERDIVYLEQVPAALFEVALSPKSFELSARVLLELGK
jgi:hypothetical protein